MPRDARSDDRDGLHGSHRTRQAGRDTVPVVSSTSVPVAIDRTAELPLHEQLERQLREAIQAGRLAPGDAAAVEPRARLDARDHARRGQRGLRPARVRGLPEHAPGRAGAGRRVGPAPAPARARPLAAPALRLRPAARAGPRARSRATRGCARCARPGARAPFDALGEPDPRGVPELREALAEQLARARGAATDPEHVLVCRGFRAGFSALCRWLARARRRTTSRSRTRAGIRTGS